MEKNTMKNEAVQKNRMGISVRKLAQIGMLSAVASVLMLFEMPLPFLPSFYKINLSEVPVLLGTFSMGPIAGVLISLIKILANFVLNGTTTGGIGEMANFLMGCMFCVPAGIIYKRKKTKKGAIIGMAVGTVSMTVMGCILNAYLLLPLYANLFHAPLDDIIAMGTAINPAIQGLTGFVMLAVMPFNLLKGMLSSLIVYLLYKKLSPILHRYSV